MRTYTDSDLLRTAKRLEDRAVSLLSPASLSALSGRTNLTKSDALPMAIRAAKEANEPYGEIASLAERAQALRWKVAGRYDRLAQQEGKGKADLVQEARVGLYMAACRFNPDLGIKFSVYGRWWARALVIRYSEHDHTIRLSGATHEQLRTLRRWQALGLTGSDLADALGLPLERVEQILSMVHVCTVDSIEPKNPRHTDGDGNGVTDAKTPRVDPSLDVEDAVLYRQIEQIVGRTMHERGARVFMQYHKSGDEGSLRDLAAREGVSREAVRRDISTCMEKLQKICAVGV